MVDHINNGEEGYSVREKLNTVIDRTNTLNGIENQVESNKNLSQQNKAAIEKEVQDRKDADAALQAEIDKKADSEHTHEIADVDGLQDILDNKQESGDYVTEAPDDGYQYARQFIVDDPDSDGVMTWTIVRAGGAGGGGAGMVIRATPPDPDDRVVGMQWLNELNGEVWIWDGARWLEFPAEGGLHKGGGGGVPFPAEELRTGQWLAYRQVDEVFNEIDGTQESEGVYEWGILTTDMVSTNPLLDDPDSASTLKLLQRWGADLEGLDNQLKVNRFIYDKLIDVEERAVNFGFIEVPNGEKVLRHDPNLLNHGGGVAADDCLILHVDIDETTTTSPNQKLVFVCPEGQEVIDHFEATQQEAIFKVVQIDDSDGSALSMTMRGINGGVMSGDVYTIECDQVYGDDLVGGKPCQLLVRTSSAITAEWVENNFVQKYGGDSMEGPLTILPQDVTNARDTKRINTYGVYSGSASSALRLGTTRDRVYIGHDDTAINGPLKVSVIEEKNSGDGIYIADQLKFTGDNRDIMGILPNDGATHTVDVFKSGLANGSNLDLKLYGSTYKNKLRIYGRSNAASLVAQIASDGSFNLYTPLDMNGEKISELADPESPQDAVNQRTLTAAIDAIPAPPETDLTPIQEDIDNLDDRVSVLEQSLLTQGEYRRQAETYPDVAGEFTTLSSGGSPNAMVANIRTIWVADRNAAGSTVDLAGFNGTTIKFLDGEGERYTFTVSGKNNGATNEEGITYFSFSVSGGYHTGGETVMAVGEQLFLELPGHPRSVTTASLPLEHPQDPPPTKEIIVEGWETQSDANQTFLVADYAQQQEILALDDRVVALEGAGGSGVGSPESHTMLGKGSWGNSKDQLSTNQFYGIDYSDRGRGVMDQYTYGLVFASRFADKVTSNYTFQAGAWVEVYNNNGELIFSQEIDSMEVVGDHLYLRWEYAPQIYRYSYTPGYGTSMFVKLHGVGDPTHQTGAFSAPEKLAPPEGDPFVGE